MESKMVKLSSQQASKILTGFFLRNGILRSKNELRHRIFGSKKYKKGYEVRFVLKNQEEVDQVRAALIALEINVVKTFTKANQIVQPVYGEPLFKKMEKVKKKAEKDKESRG